MDDDIEQMIDLLMSNPKVGFIVVGTIDREIRVAADTDQISRESVSMVLVDLATQIVESIRLEKVREN